MEEIHLWLTSGFMRITLLMRLALHIRVFRMSMALGARQKLNARIVTRLAAQLKGMLKFTRFLNTGLLLKRKVENLP